MKLLIFDLYKTNPIFLSHTPAEIELNIHMNNEHKECNIYNVYQVQLIDDRNMIIFKDENNNKFLLHPIGKIYYNNVYLTDCRYVFV